MGIGQYSTTYIPQDPFAGVDGRVPPEWMMAAYQLQQQRQAQQPKGETPTEAIKDVAVGIAKKKARDYLLNQIGGSSAADAASAAQAANDAWNAGGNAATSLADSSSALSSGLNASAEANAAYNAAGMGVPEAQAAWNAAATEAGGGLSGAGAAGAGEGVIGTTGQYLGPVGLAAGAYGLHQALKKGDKGMGALAGAGLAGGAMGTLALANIWNPAGWALGAGLLGGALLGGGATGLFGNKMRFKHEYERAQKLRDAGINWGFNAEEPTKGRSKADMRRTDLADDYVGFDPQNVWVNNKFNQSRNEADLQPMDIQGYSFLPEILGNDYANADLDTRLKIADAALKLGVREHTGEIDMADKANNEVLKQQAQAILAAKNGVKK